MVTNAFDDTDETPDGDIDIIWNCVKEIVRLSISNTINYRNENAWCYDVVSPMLKLAVRNLPVLRAESVETYKLRSNCVPVTQNGVSVQKQTDFSYSFDRSNPSMESVYGFLEQTQFWSQLSHASAVDGGSMLLFSGFEVKHEGGSREEALFQLSVWFTAHLKHLQQLHADVRRTLASDKLKLLWEELPPTVGCVIIGQDWYFYTAYARYDAAGKEQVCIVGPYTKACAGTSSFYDIFELLKLLRRVALYGVGYYWKWLRENILQQAIPVESLPVTLSGEDKAPGSDVQ